MLTHDYLISVLEYHSETGVFYWRSSPSVGVRPGSVAGSRTDKGYVSVKLLGSKYRAHRLAWLYVTGAWPDLEIDHINRDRSDNRIDNLMEVTGSLNCHNSVKCETSGVYQYDYLGSSVIAAICVDGVRHRKVFSALRHGEDYVEQAVSWRSALRSRLLP